MGIPSYFRIILQRYKDSHNDKNTNKTDYFLIDFNSILYSQVGGLEEAKYKNKTTWVQCKN